MNKNLWISYFLILTLIAGLIASLAAFNPLKDFGSTVLLGLSFYLLLAVSLTYHCHKIAEIRILYAIIITVLVVMFGAFFASLLYIYIIPETIMNIITPNYFMEYFISCVFVGIIHVLVIMLVKKLKENR